MPAMLGAMCDPSRHRAIEEQHLAEADRHIAEGKERRAQQVELVERLVAAGHDTAEAQRLLDNITDLLVTARAHRRLILRRLEEG
jgi:hypothetical protein